MEEKANRVEMTGRLHQLYSRVMRLLAWDV